MIPKFPFRVCHIYTMAKRSGRHARQFRFVTRREAIEFYEALQKYERTRIITLEQFTRVAPSHRHNRTWTWQQLGRWSKPA